MMCSLMPSERSSAASFLQSNRASFSWGSLDEELDDSLLELSDGEEDDGHFSYTEEEIQELLKDDDLSNSWGGGLQKDDGGHVEKGGRGGAVLLDPAREESSLCSPGPVPRSPGLSKLPQLHASVGLRPTPPKSLNRRFALENNLIKVTVVAPFNPTASDAVHAESKVNSSKITENPSSLREEMRDSPTSSESGPCTESKGVRPINSAQDGPLFSSSHDNIQQTVSDKNLPRSKKPTPISPQISDRPETPTAESTWQNEESQKSSSSETEFSVVSNSPNKDKCSDIFTIGSRASEANLSQEGHCSYRRSNGLQPRCLGRAVRLDGSSSSYAEPQAAAPFRSDHAKLRPVPTESSTEIQPESVG
ncbi:S100P-binding protein isoform X2 [Ochotona curzoniae]|uniref:S100P-binding protein isoform X2 n=1 Tax=Ochotona curzoniae TaxID=130825 RepID=UPI001B34960E|nr:S100P-binding protein isoform X2 [Ochotona curzoniae]